MEISSATLAAREQMLNRATVGQDILQRTLEKAEEAKQVQQQDKPQEVRLEVRLEVTPTPVSDSPVQPLVL